MLQTPTKKNALSGKRRKALVFGVTGNLDFALGAMIVGFLKHNPDYDGEIVVFHEGIDQQQQDVFHGVFSDISFREFRDSHVRQRFGDSVDAQSVGRLVDRYSHFYFAKFEIFDLLDEFERVVWMDVDMLVRAPLDAMWEFDEFCWREIGADARKKQNRAFVEFSDEINGASYLSGNGGVIGVSQAARNENALCSSQAYRLFAEYEQRARLAHGDEFAIFLMACSVDANPKPLPLAFNCPSATRGAADAKIIHAIGKDKFWNNHALKLAYPDWWLWYNEWVRAGGRKMTTDLAGGGVVKTPNGIVYSARYENHWRDLFELIWDKLPDGVIPDVSMHRDFYQIFLKGCPRSLLHIEVTKLDKDFEVSLDIEGAATENAALLSEISGRLSALQGFKQTAHKYGLRWGCRCAPADLDAGVLRLANAIQGLDYGSPQ